ncbi:MAG: Pycsar system effector family protein [Verrucomicrobiota bacterium]
MKIDQPGAHLDQMLRQTRAHHVQLSSMADMKANMLLTMSAVVITLSAPRVAGPNFQWPFAVLIVFCLLTVGLAAYAVMPKLPLASSREPLPAIDNPHFNLLFFGDFIRLDYPTFEASMEKMMNDPSRTYEAQVREVYVLGLFLAAKKYRFLRLAYISFIVGLFACFLWMLISSVHQ